MQFLHYHQIILIVQGIQTKQPFLFFKTEVLSFSVLQSIGHQLNTLVLQHGRLDLMMALQAMLVKIQTTGFVLFVNLLSSNLC